MKTFVLAGLLAVVGLGACSTLRPPTREQLAAGQQAVRQQVAARPLNVYIHDAPTAIPKNKPLVFVDGRKYRFGKLMRVGPANIDSVNAFNSEASTAMYGKRGRYGVVVITTKKKSNR